MKKLIVSSVLAFIKAAERTDITFLQKLPLFQKGKESYEPVD
jgi:adenine phosphoribosyltransferase